MPSVITPKRSARRCLFGRPTAEQQKSTREWLDRALEDIIQRDCEKWGFDFKLGVPTTSSSDYVYEPIGELDVPLFYRSKHLSISGSSIGDSSTASSPISLDKEELPELLNISSCSSELSDVSMDFEPVPPAKRTSHTPKKRQNKLTDYIPIRRKKLSRSPKESLNNTRSPSPSSSTSRRIIARHF